MGQAGHEADIEGDLEPRQTFVTTVVEELRQLNDEISPDTTLDLMFLAYLRATSQFGFFRYGPVTIDTHVVEDIAARTIPRRKATPDNPPKAMDDYIRFSRLLMDEVRRSGRSRVDELHYLLALMRCNEGLPGRVFGELGVTPEAVERYGRSGTVSGASLEKLYSPEEAAEYLGVHVQTVRAWIRSGRLPASRLTGQRALRIRASDLASVLEPVTVADFETGD